MQKSTGNARQSPPPIVNRKNVVRIISFVLSVLAMLGPASVLAAGNSRNVAVAAGTAIEIQLDKPLSSQTNVTNDTFTFVVAADTVVDGYVVIPKGAKGAGHVADASKAQWMGRPGILTIAVDWVTDIAGAKVHVTGTSASAGGDNMNAQAGAVGAASVASMINPLFAFGSLAARGKKAAIGTEDKIRIFVRDSVHIKSSQKAVADGFEH